MGQNILPPSAQKHFTKGITLIIQPVSVSALFAYSQLMN